MKNKIHPTYYKETKVICACGNEFTTGSTKKEIKVEICSNCHPFFTGKMRFIDTMGRVEKFQQKQKAAQTKKYIKKADRKNKKIKKQKEAPQTLKEMIQKQKKKARKSKA